MSIDDRESTLRAAESVAINWINDLWSDIWDANSRALEFDTDMFVWNKIADASKLATREAVYRPGERAINAAVQAAWEASGA